MPKAELHVHLEGSLAPRTILELAERNRIALPWSTPGEIQRLFRLHSFDDFKQALLLGVRCLRTGDDFVLAVERLGDSLAAHNVRYAEVTVTPQFHARAMPEMDAWLAALNEGRRRVARTHAIELRWIPDIVRSVPRFARTVAAWASGDRARSGGVVALGLGGPERGHSARDFADVFAMARERGLSSVPHAGEGTGPQGVRDALEHLLPSRIGHGVGAADDPSLMAQLARRGIALEVCVTSNLRLGLYPDSASHPLRRLIDAGCVVTLNTDDPAIFGTTLTDEYVQTIAACGLSQEQLGQCASNAARASLLPAAEKAALVDEITRGARAALGVVTTTAPEIIAAPSTRPRSEPAFRAISRFDGPNRYIDRPAIVAEVARAELPVDAMARLTAALDALQPAYVAERLHPLPVLETFAMAASHAALVVHAALTLQRWAGHPVSRGTAVIDDQARQGDLIAFEYVFPPVAQAAGTVAALMLQEVCAGAIDAGASPGTRALQRFVNDFVDRPEAGVAFIRAAQARGIPWRSVVPSEAVIDLGQGRKQRRVWRNFTGATSQIATRLSTHKHMAGEIFRSHGLPTPRQALVRDEATALRAARTIGVPVVVKPASTDFGTAVHLDLRSDDEIRKAFAAARRHGAVLVEEQIAGDHHRLMVINGRFTSARRQKPAHVVGDGTRTIRALVDAANAIRIGNGWRPIPMDSESEFVLARQALTPDSVLAAGAEARLRTQGNLSTGGTMDVVTDRIHPDNVRLALRAAAVTGIDVAGIDFITPDIARSHLDVGGAICEINVTPGFILGEEEILLDDWFPAGDDGRMPIVAILDPVDEHLGRCIATLLSARFAPVCRAASTGVWVGDARIVGADMAGAQGARIALAEPGAAAAVVEIGSNDVLRRGLRFDRCSALVVPPPSSSRAAALGANRVQALRIAATTAAAIVVDASETDIAEVASAANARGTRHLQAARGAAARCPICDGTTSAWNAAAISTLVALLASADRPATGTGRDPAP